MARPQKEGLSYFPFDVDTFEDDKLFDVQNKYGPLGEVIYFRIISMVYKDKGYYFEFQSLDRLAAILIKSIGNRWVKNKQTVIQVILYLAECNLFSSELMRNNVITSVGIQSRYLKATERRQPNSKKYWLLSDDKGLDNLAQNKVNANINLVTDDNNSFKAYDSTQTKEKKSKENQIKLNQTKENESELNQSELNETKESQTKLNQSIEPSVEELIEIDLNILDQWNAFSQMRTSINKPLSPYSKKLILQKLDLFSLGNIEDKKKILDQSTVNSWADLYPLKQQQEKPEPQKEETSYDIDEYMKKSIGLKYVKNEDRD